VPVYRVFANHEFQVQLEAIRPPGIRDRINEKLTSFVYPQLTTQPFYGANIRKMRSLTPPEWRFRLGAWRMFYGIDDVRHIVYLHTIVQRKDAY